MELSIIIVSYNVKEYLRNCLRTVIIASERIECEIFVVDNNSADGSAEMVRHEFPALRLIANDNNPGFSKANNQAIRVSSGRYILLLNPDTLVEHDTFSKCVDFMNTHKDAGAMGVRMLNGDGLFLPESKRAFPTLSASFFKTSGISFLFPGSKYINRYYMPEIDMMETSPTEVIAGAFMFMRKEALDKSGLLDEDFFMYGEDIDLSYRLLRNGYINYYYPAISITHFKGKSTGRGNIEDVLHFYDSMWIYVRKRHAEGQYRYSRFFIYAAIRFRESLALLNRFIHLIFNRQVH